MSQEPNEINDPAEEVFPSYPTHTLLQKVVDILELQVEKLDKLGHLVLASSGEIPRAVALGKLLRAEEDLQIQKEVASKYAEDKGTSSAFIKAHAAAALDAILVDLQKPELAAELAPTVITFCLVALGQAKVRSSILTATEIVSETDQKFIVQQHSNYPDTPETGGFKEQLDLSFAEYLAKKYGYKVTKDEELGG